MRFRARLIAASAAMAALYALSPSEASASSHREAPFITKNPKVDGTDFYLFNSYESGRSGYVTMIANVQPLQDAYGGPNYFALDPEALYEIHIDNNGDASEDITFQFRFKNELANSGAGISLGVGDAGVAIPLVMGGGVNGNAGGLLGAGSVNNINVRESYSVKVVRGSRRTGAAQDVTNSKDGSTTFVKPLDYVGQKTFQAGYETYASQYRYDVAIPGCAGTARMFVGQRREGFAVNIGTIFDLVNAPLGVIANDANRAAVPNPIGNKNVTSIALEVPAACLKSATSTIIGGWQTTSLRQARVLNPNPTFAKPAREGGAWVQVSRLGMPLVNEVVIGLKDKDRFNSSEPKGDGQFAQYVTHPTLAKLIEVIYGPANAPAPTALPRADLVTAFLKGVPGVNENGAVAEYVRLNTALGAKAKGQQNSLGALECFTAPTDQATAPALDTARAGCDPSGFPNGRRPGDDVVDIALRVMMGRLLPLSQAGAGRVPLHDAVLQSDADFDDAFPYLKTPVGGS